MMNEMKTTNQMIDAPHGAYYVVPSWATSNYFVRLKNHLGRNDLKIISMAELDDGRRWCGLSPVDIVIDHCILEESWLSRKMSKTLDEIAMIEYARDEWVKSEITVFG